MAVAREKNVTESNLLDALLTVAYLINCMLSHVLGGKTPIEVLHLTAAMLRIPQSNWMYMFSKAALRQP